MNKMNYKEYPVPELETHETPWRISTVMEHDNSIEVMAQHLDDQDNGKVGIFWYDSKTKSLFGVVAIDKDSFARPNVGGGLISCRELYVNVWKKGFNKQKFKLNGVGPFIGDYKDTPRGRVFYNPATDTFEIKVGNWIKEYPEAVNEIIDEFDLTGYNYEIIIDYHWDIGNGWENL